ncbi:MAG TPA: EamA family transporter, partial [Pyrinomonadaceae bacterium]|nr:EamA family transporter [Pyrinomonadaceae bacterium]
MTQETIANKKNLIVLIGAFAAVYIFWGSTYLAIKYAMDTLPPFLMAGSRFLVAGSILYLVARFSADYERPKPVHWRTSFVVGTLLLLGGNGGVVIATLYIPSSLTALLVATEPFFIIILSWLWLKGGRPGWKASLGLLIGFAGVWLLISGRPAGGVAGTSDTGQWIGIAAVIFGALSWAAGSIYGLKSPVPKSSMQTAAMQMISGSLSLLLVGLIRGEWSRFDPSAVSANSIIGVTYLIIFGS